MVVLKCIADEYDMAQKGSACNDGECMHCEFMVCPEEEAFYRRVDYEHDLAREEE